MLPPAARYTLPANYFQTIGKVLRIKAAFRFSNITPTPGTLTLDVRMGPTSNIIVFNGGAMTLVSDTAHTTLPLWVEILLTCRAIGSGTSANLMGQGVATGEQLSRTAVAKSTTTAATLLIPATTPAVGTGFDSTVSMVVDLFATFSVSNAANLLLLHQYTLESPVSVTLTLLAGSAVYVSIFLDGGTAPVQTSGDAVTLRKSQEDSGVNQYQFNSDGPVVGGSTTFTFSYTGGGNARIFVTEVSNQQHGASGFDKAASTTTTTNATHSTGTTSTTTQAVEFVLAGFHFDGSVLTSSASMSNSFIIPTNGNQLAASVMPALIAYKEVAAVATYETTLTSDNGTGNGLIGTYKSNVPSQGTISSVFHPGRGATGARFYQPPRGAALSPDIAAGAGSVSQPFHPGRGVLNARFWTASRASAISPPVEAGQGSQSTIMHPGRRPAIGQFFKTNPGNVVVSTATITQSVNQALETDIAQPVAWAPKNRFVGQAIETDIAFAITASKIRAIGQAIETDLAQPMTVAKIVHIGQAIETDLAQPIAWAPKNRLVRQAIETDIAQPIAWAPKNRLVGQAVETDIAQQVTVVTSGGGGTIITTITRKKWHRSGS